MSAIRIRRIVTAALVGAVLSAKPLCAQDLSEEHVLASIDRAKSFLVSQQNGDGSWSARGADQYQVGVSSLVLLALLNAGMTTDDAVIQKGLKYLRSIQEPQPDRTYEISLMIMALAAAKDGQRDKPRILALAQKLEESQITQGQNAGTWGYSGTGGLFQGSGDRSNGQFAVLGLRDAAQAGIPVDRSVWQRARQHWLTHQNSDGGWGYSGFHNQSSTGSMTVAGIATMEITARMLRDGNDLNPDGTPNCCPEYEPDKPLQRGINWMQTHFAVGHNPGGSIWLLYYLYGMERAGRLSGRRFFGDHDWYREGAKFLVDRQSKRTGSWQGVGGLEQDPVIGTSFALLFLSKGLAPVLINKLKYGPANPGDPDEIVGDNWNKHRDDIRNLTDNISGLPKWPKLLTWQVVNLAKVVDHGGVEDLLQAPILYISGKDAPQLTARQIELLREYLTQGGFVFAVANCHGEGFDRGFRDLVRKMYPVGEAELRPLPPSHPIYRSEYRLDPDSVELLGVEFGCRTAIVYSPHDAALDISCLWEMWARQDPPNRPAELKSMITKAMRIGVNVVAYATGRDIPDKLKQHEQLAQDGQQDQIERGLLQIAKLRHNGAWDAAPQALRNLLMALNRTVGLAASTRQQNIPPTDPDLFKYPIVYMHGRNHFQFSRQGREQLKTYLERGGLLFADACCGAKQFDRSFRDLMGQMFPNHSLERIPADHEMFTTQVGYDVRRVKRRAPEADNPNAALNTVVREVEPFLEGIQLDGRYAVIYSKYDISCALERQASVACSGYLSEDALKLAVNVVLYALLQDARYAGAAN